MARILLVDDDHPFRIMLGRVLTLHGHTVIEARDGKEGLKLFPHIAVDLVITDMVMPEKEGIEVLLALRKLSPSVKVIAMSGGGRVSAEDNLRMAKLLGAAKVFPKPFPSGTLLSAIDSLLSDDAQSAPSGKADGPT
jgi:DNA-binding response OmpR family regulator